MDFSGHSENSPADSAVAVADVPAARAAMRLTSMDVAMASRALSAALGRLVSEEQVRQVVEAGGFARADGTFSLIEYVAFLAGEVSNGGD